MSAPTLRLAHAKMQDPETATATYERIRAALGPTIYLSRTGHARGAAAEAARFGDALGPTVRLAHVPGAQGDNNLKGQRGVEQLGAESAPALLVSYFYLEPFLKAKGGYVYRDWALDSGAYSAKNSGAVISLDAYTEKAKELLASDPLLSEVFALDVIGDWRATVANTESMWRAGVTAIPTYHEGSPWDVLVGLCKDYPKVALGGVALRHVKDKERFAAECFSRAWPKRLHGFGYGAPRYLRAFPFHSVDATNWEVAACKYGRWASFGGEFLRIPGLEAEPQGGGGVLPEGGEGGALPLEAGDAAPRKPLLIVGQAPSFRYGTEVAFRASRSGFRLEKLLGVQPGTLLQVADTVNLLPGFPGKATVGDRFPVAEARAAAAALDLSGRALVLLCGRGVATAFDLARVPFLRETAVRGVRAIILAHPSGVSRWWNDPANGRRAAALLRVMGWGRSLFNEGGQGGEQ